VIEKVIEYSIRNRFVVFVITAALAVWGIYAVLNTPVDAIPDLSENQVIVFTDWMGRSPKEIQDQITYPLSLKLQGLAGIKAVRSSSEFNFSMITLIFEDNVDFYFARVRVLEKLALAGTFLPPGVVPYLAPDATALGQVFWYTLEPGPSHAVDRGQLTALNQFTIAPALNGVPGVAEVATVGGTPLEYQIDVKPEALRAYGVTLGDLYAAVARSNLTVGGRVIHKNGAEYAVRGVGYLGTAPDGETAGPEQVRRRVVRHLEDTVVRQSEGTPVYVKNVAKVQLGQQFRRSVFEKDGNEVAGGVVLMRHGQNPLAITRAVKHKIQELQSELPEGVRIVPAYDRTRLIKGAVHTLTEVMWHEMLIATVAILLILWHFRSAFVICVTLPLSVLFSFLLMWLLRKLGIIDIQANIMSLAGITISIGILVDQAIVMVENATHHLKEKFGDRNVTGDTRETVIRACRTVGRPIFFSVMIMLISFIPVFMLTGREGKYFHPLAFTKSFALVGVALISVTVVPALIPTFIKGRLRREDENWIVRSFINIYKPVLTWFFPRLNLVMWMFAALLIVASAMFPLQAVIGLGASETAWKTAFLIVLFVVTALTTIFTRGLRWQVVTLASLLLLGLWAYHHWDPKGPHAATRRIGVEFIPPLDEGSLMEMPVTAARVSLTQAADDLKARDALLRSFPEVESVVGKAGRANTATDPSGLDMIETFINFRPRELWPKRVLPFKDAEWQTRMVLHALEQGGYVRAAEHAADRDSLVNDAAQKALERFDEVMRELALLRYREFERELGPVLTRFVIDETLHRFRAAGILQWPPDVDERAEVDRLVKALAPDYGLALSKNPALEDVTKLCQEAARHLATLGALRKDGEEVDAATALALHESPPLALFNRVAEALGAERKTFASEVFNALERHRMDLWRTQVKKKINWELFDQGIDTFTWLALEELAKGAEGIKDDQGNLLEGVPHGAETVRLAADAIKTQRDLGKKRERPGLRPFVALHDELNKPFARRVVSLWPRQSKPDGDLVRDEMERVLQVPGWKNVITQPIINRIEMLSTGVRNDVGVKVFGRDLATIDEVSKKIAGALEKVKGAQGVLAWQIRGKDYLEVHIDRKRAARYGVSVADIQDTIEVALGGRVITQTIEDRNRFPVRIRYARAQRGDEEAVKRLLVSSGSGMSAPPMGDSSGSPAPPAAGGGAVMSPAAPGGGGAHDAAPAHATAGKFVQVPLSAVADVQIVEGPATIRGENGQLLNYVTLNVRGRDMVGFVEEAQRVVREQVTLPEGVHIEWTGQFEHQIRAANTLRFIFPAVIVLIFVILYLTYKDLADASLMMLAVPEALAGGIFFLFFFPKIIGGWDAKPMDFSVAVWVGFIACFGMATETGIIMLVYLREALEKRGGLENIRSLEELRQAVIEGAVHRLRPKLLTEGVAIIAIFPMVFARGVGGEILAPMALPVLGGLLISDEVVDIFLPVRFYWVRRGRWQKLQEQKGRARNAEAAAAQSEGDGQVAQAALGVS
jgi:Cu(I)/Ag(I) efflux system membrane protein CusA/SilA